MNNNRTIHTQLLSPDFTDGEYLPHSTSYDGGNTRPRLFIENAPADTKSLAIICHDPDAPTVGGFTHWLIWNLTTHTHTLDSQYKPDGSIEGLTDWGEFGWGGPKPPSGTHRYIFTLYALDTDIQLPPSACRTDLITAMQGHVLSQATLTGLYAA